MRDAGFEVVELRFVNDPGEQLRDVEVPVGAEWDSARAALARNRELLNTTLFAPLDYALLARRP